jgi:hypothetical protein
MWRVCSNLLWLACIGIAFSLDIPRALAAGDFAREYGNPKAAISSREAGELLLELVNAERAKHGLSRVELSASASKLARQHADDMAEHGYVGHYDLEGRKCELRYNLLGETDHVAENLAMREVGARVRLTPELVRGIFADWMGSKSHRMNIHDPGHTHMGYGFALEHGGRTKIYAVQEFVNDFGDYSLLPRKVGVQQSITIKGRLTGKYPFSCITIAHEAPPNARAPKDVGEADLHYRQPVPELVLLADKAGPVFYNPPGTLKPPEKIGAVKLSSSGKFEATYLVPDSLQVPTDVYVSVWVETGGRVAHARAMTQVVRVE